MMGAEMSQRASDLIIPANRSKNSGILDKEVPSQIQKLNIEGKCQLPNIIHISVLAK